MLLKIRITLKWILTAWIHYFTCFVYRIWIFRHNVSCYLWYMNFNHLLMINVGESYILKQLLTFSVMAVIYMIHICSMFLRFLCTWHWYGLHYTWSISVPIRNCSPCQLSYDSLPWIGMMHCSLVFSVLDISGKFVGPTKKTSKHLTLFNKEIYKQSRLNVVGLGLTNQSLDWLQGEACVRPGSEWFINRARGKYIFIFRDVYIIKYPDKVSNIQVEIYHLLLQIEPLLLLMELQYFT